MAGLRKGHCYTTIERPYTRRSKFKKQNYIKAIPSCVLVKLDMGERKKEFPVVVELKTKRDIQIRHNSLEAARTLINRHMHEKIGSTNYRLRVRVYPHHIIRENKMIGGAHADRLQSGMAHSFGKAIGLAAQARKGKTLFEAFVNKDKTEETKKILMRAAPKLPCGCYVVVTQLKQ